MRCTVVIPEDMTIGANQIEKSSKKNNIKLVKIISDLLVTKSSITALDAILCDKPVNTVNFKDKEEPIHMHQVVQQSVYLRKIT